MFSSFRGCLVGVVVLSAFAGCSLLQGQTFSAGVPVNVGANSNPKGIAYGDFNNDGNLDFATSNGGSSSVTVMLGNGTGGFTPAPKSPFSIGSAYSDVIVADFNLDGNLDLAIPNLDLSLNVLLGDGHGNFSNAAGSPIAGMGSFVVVGDFNGDGKPDLAAITTSVVILLGNGDGTFSKTGALIPLGGFCRSGAAVDFNGDGKLDLAIGNYDKGTVIILLGNGTGGFTAAPGSGFASGTNPFWVSVADFNADGKLDLAVANSGGNSVSIFKGDGTGQFSAFPASPFAVSTPQGIAVADFDGDGHPDLAVTSFTNGTAGTVTVLLGDGVGGFTAGTGSPFTTANGSRGVVAADFNNDGQPDLLVANNYANTVTVLLNNLPLELWRPAFLEYWAFAGQKTPVTYSVNQFGPPFPVALQFPQPWLSYTFGCVFECISVNASNLSAGLYTATAHDTLNGHAYGGHLGIKAHVTYPSTGAMTASAGSPFGAGTNPRGIASGDFNGDGKRDFAIANGGGNVSILLGDGIGGFSNAPGSPIAVGTNTSAVAVGDFNGDGKLDLAVSNQGSNNVSILLGNGQGGFTSPGPAIAAGTGPYSIAAADFNGDAILDLAVAHTDGSVHIYLGTGSGSFHSAPDVPLSTGGILWRVLVSDFNGDGIADLAVANDGGGGFYVYLGNGKGGFTEVTGSPFAGGGRDLVVGDLNGDGKADMAGVGGNSVTVWLGDGTGGFTQATGSPFNSGGAFPDAITMGDFDGDGIPDLAVVNANTSGLNTVIFKGSGTGTFSSFKQFTGGSIVYGHIVADDFNGDGTTDLAIADFASNNVTVLLNHILLFTPTVALSAMPSSVALGNSVNLQATISGPTTFNKVPTGTVNFLDGTTTLGSATLSNGVATLSVNSKNLNPTSGPGSSTVGVHQITASYLGDSAFSTASGASNVTVNGIATVAPSSGSGSTQSFTFTFPSPGGYQDLAGAQIVINPSLTAVNSCYILFARPDVISLAADSGNSFQSTSLGAPAVLQNSQCVVLASLTSQSGSGNTVTLTLNVVFKAAFVGPKTVWANYNTNEGVAAGYLQLGTYTATLPQAGFTSSVSPASGSGQAQAFTFSYFDAFGAPDISGAQIAFNTTLSGAHACYILLSAANTISLASDDAGTFNTAVFGQQRTLQNSQCTVFPGASYQTQAGQTLNFTVFVTFKTGFNGAKNIYSSVNNNAGLSSGFSTVGIWNVTDSVGLSPLAAYPASASGPSQTLTFVYADSNGAADIQTTEVIINPTANPTSNTCLILFTPSSGDITLLADDGHSAADAIAGQPKVLQNSQCIINAAQSSQVSAGNYLTLTLFVTMKTSGSQNVYSFLHSPTLGDSTLSQVGTWNVTSPTTMTPVSVAPFTGFATAGSTQSFTFTLSDPAGANDISGALILLYPSLQGANACYVLWGHNNNLISLAKDDVSGFTSATAGAQSVLSNSQCSVDASKSFSVQTGNTVNLTLAVSFSAAYKQFPQIYSWVNVQNQAHALSGWFVESRFAIK